MRAAGVRLEVRGDACGLGKAGGAPGWGRRRSGVRWVRLWAAGSGERCIRRRVSGVLVRPASEVRREVVRLQAAWVRREVRQDAGGGCQACGAEGCGWCIHPAVGGVGQASVCRVLGVSVQCIELWAAGDRHVVCRGSGVSVPCIGLQAAWVSRQCVGRWGDQACSTSDTGWASLGSGPRPRRKHSHG
jgi:hypothetical protein